MDLARTLGQHECLRVLERGCRKRRRRSGFPIGTPPGDARTVDFTRVLAVWERFFENAAKMCLRQDMPHRSPLDEKGSAFEDIPCGAELVTSPLPFPIVQGGSQLRRTNSAKASYGRGPSDGNGGDLVADAHRALSLPGSARLASAPPSLGGVGSLRGALVAEEAFARWAPLQGGGVTHFIGDDHAGTPSTSSCVFYSPTGSNGTRPSSPSTYHDTLSPDRWEEYGDEEAWWAATDQGRAPDGLWVACWDRNWESVYYTHLITGATSWDPPPGGVPPYVWDPDNEAYFVVGEGGGSRWVREGVDPWAPPAAKDGTAADTAGTHGICWSFPCPSAPDVSSISRAFHEFQPKAHYRLGRKNRSWRDAVCSNNTAGAHPEAAVCGDLGEGAILADRTFPWMPSGFLEIGESGSSSEFFESREALREPRSGCYTRANFNAGERDPEPEFHDTQTQIELHSAEGADGVATARSPGLDSTRLGFPEYVLWYGHDRAIPPYYVNEETMQSVWTIPWDVSQGSHGWLRAWSEEHGAEFYVNQWTGHTSWSLPNLELSG